MRRRQLDKQSAALHELSSVLLNMLRSPPAPIDLLFDHLSPAILPPARRRVTVTPISPAGFASLMLGISLALILCGSITFFIGFMLIPWVLGLFMVLYFIGLISTLSILGRSILSYATTATVKPPSPASSFLRKDISDTIQERMRSKRCSCCGYDLCEISRNFIGQASEI